MKKMTLSGLALSLLIAAVAAHQRAQHLKGEHLDKGKTMTNSDAEPEVVGTVDLGLTGPALIANLRMCLRIRDATATPWRRHNRRIA
jgi:hypothetical protein